MSFLKNIFFALTKKERIGFLVSSAVAVVSFVVVISLVIAHATTAVPTLGGDYRTGVVGQPEYINPVTAQSDTDLSLVKLLYANVPDIADKIESSTTGLAWTVHLKSGLTWQDGQKLTSDDVIFTVQSIENQDANSPLYASWQGVSVSRVSELEVQFTLANPYAFFADDLQNLYIIPKHIFADVPPGNWRLADYNLKPVGSGPYKFASYDENQDGFISGYHLQAWNGYAGQQPLIAKLDFSFFHNTSDLLASFNAGQINGFGNVDTNELPSINRPYTMFAWRTPSYYAIFFNQSKNLALQDANVREALSEAVDRNALIASALAGKGAADNGPIPPDAAYFSPTQSTTSIALAEQTLDAAGWTISSSSNFRAKTIQKVSVPLVVNLTVPNIDFLVAAAQSIEGTWQSMGVQVNVATSTTQSIITDTIKNRNYESLLFGNVLGASSDLYSFWDSSQRFSPGLNLAIYNNSRVDSLIETARESLSEASRTQELATAQSDIVNDNPAVFLFSPDYLYVTDKSVQGISPDLLIDPSDLSREMAGWYLNTTRVLK